jgi:hypothetical protein
LRGRINASERLVRQSAWATSGRHPHDRVTVVLGKTTFPFVLGKDPKRRKSRSGSYTGGNGSGTSTRTTRATRERTRDKTREKDRSNRGPRQSGTSDGQFVLYVEGARDREILGCWARRIDPSLTRCIEQNTVILGGRRPARAVEDFQKRGGRAAGYSGLIVLDRDDLPHGDSDATAGRSSAVAETAALGGLAIHPDRARSTTKEAGLELFVWSLRHIESYLLVPEAIRRMLGLEADDRRIERSIEATPSESSPGATRRSSLHAKRILGSGGALSEALGTELRAGEIARAMRPDELHGDVRILFDRIGALSGLSVKAPEVVIRS